MINKLWRRFWFRPWNKKWYWLKVTLGVICLDSKLNGLKIAWKRISLHGPPSARVAKCASPRKMRGHTQNAWAHAKCANPRKVRGPTQSARAALWVRGTPSARTRAKCVGRGSIARAALSARAAIAWRGEWAALPTHLPRTCHSMPTQCNRGSTRVGRDEPQSPGTLRVNMLLTHHDRLNIDTSISVIVVSPATWEAHHTPWASPSGCGERNLGINSYKNMFPLIHYTKWDTKSV